MKFNKTKVIMCLVFALFSVICFLFTLYPPEFMQYSNGMWKIGTFFVGGFCLVASIYSVFYKGE